MLSVGRSEGMKLTTNAETIYHNSNRIGKLFTSICTMFFAASIVYEFITEGWSHAVIQLVIYIATIFMSLFFGAMSGLKGAQIKLSTVEEVCSLLEDWRNQPPQIDKYDEAKDDTVKDEIVKPVEVEPQKSVDNRVIEIE